ncbi:MAG: type II toxin-antitoxin system Phd/YefM family antitoxin [Myxococcota bacterium]
MRRSGITEAKNNLSALLERVKAGETIVIEERGVPIATLEPLAASRERASLGRLERLEQQGIVRRGRSGLPAGFLDWQLPKAKGGVAASQLLIEDRRSGR